MTGTLQQEIETLESSILPLVGPEALPKILQEVITSVSRWSEADRVSLIQFDLAEQEVRHFLRGGSGWADVMSTIGMDELKAGLSGWALRTGEVALSPGNVPDPRESPEVQKRRRETNCGAILVAPLGSAEHRFGTITLINRPDQREFTVRDASDLSLYAHYVTWAVRWALDQERTVQAETQAQQALRSKTQFLSNLSHELRTPLNGVLGFSHLLDATVVDPTQKAMVQTILQSGQRLLSTVDNLLELAQFETGEFHLETAPFSPRAVLDAVVAKHADFAKEKQLEWKINIAADLPVLLQGDSVRMGQAWDHILSNAVKFTERGTIAVQLESRVTASGRSELILNVTDTGIGFTHGHTGQWFMPFHQEDGSLTRKFGGTGLGLALSDRIVRMMGGGLSLWGEPGVGTKVRIWVDLDHNSAEPRRFVRKALRVLLQDQDPVGSMVLIRLLESLGHRVDYVAQFGPVPERLRSQTYELLIAEVPTPDSNFLFTLKDTKEFSLIGLYTPDDPPGPGEPWTTTLMKPVTNSTLQAALKRCRPWEES